MQNFDIEKYIQGKMTGAEKSALETEMKSNTEFAKEVHLAKQLAEDIEMQSMRKEIRSIMKNNKTSDSRKYGLGLTIITAILAIGIYGYFFTGNDQSETIINQPELQDTPPEEKTIFPPEDINKENEKRNIDNKKETPTIIKSEKKKSPPVAQNDSPANIAPLLFPAPKLRGENKDNEAWSKLLNQIWYTKFPPNNVTFSEPYIETTGLLSEREFTKAFTKLEILGFKIPENDTLSYLKGYCLTEMGEGADAIHYFEKIKNPPKEWEDNMEWHTALSVLTSQGITASLPYFEKIEADKKHNFQKESAHSVQILKDNM